jgi:hypothetical protein
VFLGCFLVEFVTLSSFFSFFADLPVYVGVSGRSLSILE